MPGYARPTTTAFAQDVAIIPTGNISSTSIQSAIQELDTEKASVADLANKETSIPLQSTAPTSPATSDLWVDNTVATAPQLKVYNGTSWIALGSAVDDDQLILAQRMFM